LAISPHSPFQEVDWNFAFGLVYYRAKEDDWIKKNIYAFRQFPRGFRGRWAGVTSNPLPGLSEFAMMFLHPE
jgi:hypothetical protein